MSSSALSPIGKRAFLKMVSNKVIVIVVAAIAVMIGSAVAYLAMPTPIPLSLDVKFQHPLRDDATHYSVNEGTRRLFSSTYKKVIFEFTSVPEHRLFTKTYSMEYGSYDVFAFKIIYYRQIAQNEYTAIETEYIEMRVKVSEDGDVIWEDFS